MDNDFNIIRNKDGTYTAYIAQREKTFPDVLKAAEWCIQIGGETDARCEVGKNNHRYV